MQGGAISARAHDGSVPIATGAGNVLHRGLVGYDLCLWPLLGVIE